MNIPTITAQDLRDRLRGTSDLVLLDVRHAGELLEGFIATSIHLPLPDLVRRAHDVLPDPEAPTVVYCAHGTRSAQAVQLLLQLGFTRVEQLELGFARWQDLGFPVVVPEPSATDFCARPSPQRYCRQVLLEQVGSSGQERLSRAKVLLVGLGGLGSPAALYLAGAGVGTLGLVDPDVVDLSNLHRQVIHTTSRLGSCKVDSARAQIADLNPEIAVETYVERFSAENAERILDRGWDVILDGGDNFALRYTLNDAAVTKRVAVCHGSIDRFEGRVTTFLAERGPCYRCLFPQPPPPFAIGSCAERGVVGVLPGVIGVLQATEALKLILGIGQPLAGRLLTYDALDLSFRELRYACDPNCPVCATRTRVP